jgi:hypothetical protein
MIKDSVLNLSRASLCKFSKIQRISKGALKILEGDENELKEWLPTYLDSCLQGQERIPRITHLENPSKPILCQISNLQYFQFWRNTPQIQFINQNIVDDYRRLRWLIESRCEHLPGPGIEIRICRQRRPVEIEGHVEMALDTRGDEKLGF